MRRPAALLLSCAIGSCLSLSAQTTVRATGHAPEPPEALVQALVGDWTGVLEYRDYSEPPTSPKRVQLPTWLAVTQAPEGLRFHYIYDDGPAKIVEETPVVVIDTAAKSYRVISTDSAQVYDLSGLDQLKDGRGELILTGRGLENGKPADLRQTVTIRRNLLVILEESRTADPGQPFAFRHLYVFTRARPPAVTAAP